jgi:hypothetical protein
MRLHRLGLLAAAGATLFQFGSCNPTIRATVEDGLITLTTALFSSFVEALLQVVQEGAPA